MGLNGILNWIECRYRNLLGEFLYKVRGFERVRRGFEEGEVFSHMPKLKNKAFKPKIKLPKIGFNWF